MFKQNQNPIVLGAAPFGTGVSRETSFAIIDTYLDQGGSIIDTAAVYGMGTSEQTIGAYLKERKMRSKVYISTKGGHPSLPDWRRRINESEIRADIEASLKNLETDHVDVYFLHRDDEDQSVEDIMPILDKLVREGKARFIGASNWTVARINEANEFARKNGLCEFSTSQIFWCGAVINKEGVYDKTLVAMDDTEHKGYAENRLPVMAYTSQARGLFSRLGAKGLDSLSEDMKRTYINSQTLARAERISALAAESGLSHTAISLAYLLYDKSVNAYPIIGTSRPERIAEAMEALSLKPHEIDALLDNHTT